MQINDEVVLKNSVEHKGITYRHLCGTVGAVIGDELLVHFPALKTSGIFKTSEAEPKVERILS